MKDRVSGRSKGVGYVEFKNEESVPAAIQLTDQKLLGIPIIAQLTEAEKNRQVRNPATLKLLAVTRTRSLSIDFMWVIPISASLKVIYRTFSNLLENLKVFGAIAI